MSDIIATPTGVDATSVPTARTSQLLFTDDAPIYLISPPATQSSPTRFAVQEAYRPPPTSRPLAQISGELGHALLARSRYPEAAQAFLDAIREDELSPDLYIYLGLAREGHNRIEEALRAYLEAVKLSPTTAVALLPWAYKLLPRTGDRGKSLARWLDGSWYKKMPPQLDESATLLILKFLGSACLFRGDYLQASIYLRDARAVRPDDVFTLEWLGYALGRQEDRDGAIRTLQEAVSQADAGPKTEPRISTRLKLGQFLLEIGRSPEVASGGAGPLALALEVVQAALDLSADTSADTTFDLEAADLKCDIVGASAKPKADQARAYLDAGKRYYWKSKQVEATERFRFAQSLAPDDQSISWYLADSLAISSDLLTAPYVAKDKLADARDIWQRAIEKGLPAAEFTWAYLTRATIHYLTTLLPNSDRWSELWHARLYVERALMSRDWDASTWTFLCQYDRLLGNQANALQASENALSRDPKDRAALEERALICATSGQFPEADDALDQLGSSTLSPTAASIKAFLQVHDPAAREAALNRLNDTLKASPTDLWSLGLRAVCYDLLEQPDRAAEDYEQIWMRSTDPDYQAPDNFSNFGSAAYYLGTQQVPVEADLIQQAIAWFKKILDYPREEGVAYLGLGLCYLALADQTSNPDNVETAQHLLGKGIQLAVNVRQLDELRDWDLPVVERLSVGLTHRDEVAKLLESIRGQISERRKELEQPPSPEDELERLLATLGTDDRTNGWAVAGAQAGLARLHAAAERWTEAGRIYQRLKQQPDLFPEASTGLATAIDGLQALGDTRLRDHRSEEALERYRESYTLAADAGDASRQASLEGRMGYASFDRGDRANARAHFANSLHLFRASGQADPGTALGELGRQIMPDVATYWSLDGEWQSAASDSGAGKSVGPEFAAARAALQGYLDTVYLTGPADESTVPVVTSITLQIGWGLIPEDANTEAWSLFTTYIPAMRKGIQNELGVIVPGVAVRDNPLWLHGEYAILLDDVPVASSRVPTDMRYCPRPASELRSAGIPPTGRIDVGSLLRRIVPRRSGPIPPPDLLEARNPSTGEAGAWYAPDYWDRITAQGLELWEEPLEFVVHHLGTVLRRNLADFVGVQEAENVLQMWEQTEEGAALVKAVAPDDASRVRVGRLLRGLVRERVPITDWKGILSAAQELGVAVHSVSDLVQHVRLRLKAQLPGNLGPSHRIDLPAAWEDRIAGWVSPVNGEARLAGERKDIVDFLTAVGGLEHVQEPNAVLVAREPSLRPWVRNLIESRFPDLMVLARTELLDGDQPPRPPSSDPPKA